MNWLDIIILVTLVINAVIGLWFGLIKAVLALVGVALGVLLAGRLYLPLSERLTFMDEGAAKVLAFVIILVAVMAAAFILAWLLTKAASAMMLGWVNRLGGALFGLLVGAIIWGTMLAACVQFFGAGDIITGSGLARVLLNYFPLGLWLLPGEFSGVDAFL